MPGSETSPASQSVLSRSAEPESSSSTFISEDPRLENSTRLIEHADWIEEKAKAIFAVGVDQTFEDGVETEFSVELESFILSYGKAAIDAIIPLILAQSANSEVASEALCILGRIDQRSSHRDRLWLIEHALYSMSPRIRDGAVIGLAWLDDPNAITPLLRAMGMEQIKDLKEDMLQVVEQLRETAKWD